jgi:hypothetical protein
MDDAEWRSEFEPAAELVPDRNSRTENRVVKLDGQGDLI